MFPTEFAIKWMYAPNERTGKYKAWSKKKTAEKVSKSRFMMVMTEKDFTGRKLKVKHLNVIDKVLVKFEKKKAGQAVEEDKDEAPKDKVDRALLEYDPDDAKMDDEDDSDKEDDSDEEEK